MKRLKSKQGMACVRSSFNWQLCKMSRGEIGARLGWGWRKAGSHEKSPGKVVGGQS